MSARVDYLSCFILHHRPYSETSLILDVFSLLHGRLGIMAKGARAGRRGLASLLQPVRKLNLAWSGRSELVTLTGAEPDGAPYRLQGRRLLSAFYLNELLLRLLHRHEPHSDLFQAYEASLVSLAGDVDEERVLRLFEKHLLQSLGYGLILDHEARSGAPVVTDRNYYYYLEHGPEGDRLDAREAVQVSGKTLISLYNEDRWDRQIAREAKHLLRSIIDSRLDQRPLQSRELYKAYLNNRAGASGHGNTD
ncbi:MAG: DNA repair protein RecO [Gammaproteobacteria bacterium]